MKNLNSQSCTQNKIMNKGYTVVKESTLLKVNQDYLLGYLKNFDELRTEDGKLISIPTDTVFQNPMPQVGVFNNILKKSFEKENKFLIIRLGV